MQSAHTLKAVHTEDEDPNLVATWLRRDPTRWTAGVMAGLFAGVVSLIVAMLLGTLGGHDLWYPAKLWSTAILNYHATAFGFNVAAIVIGFILHELVCVFWGVIFSHMVATNRIGSLLAMGLVWAAFSWVFIWNLFMQSIKPIYWAHVSSGPLVLICLAYGLSLSSVAFFDKALRGSKH